MKEIYFKEGDVTFLKNQIRLFIEAVVYQFRQLEKVSLVCHDYSSLNTLFLSLKKMKSDVVEFEQTVEHLRTYLQKFDAVHVHLDYALVFPCFYDTTLLGKNESRHLFSGKYFF